MLKIRRKVQGPFGISWQRNMQGAYAGILKGGGWVQVIRSHAKRGGGGPALGPLLKSLHRGSNGARVQTPGPPPPRSATGEPLWLDSDCYASGEHTTATTGVVRFEHLSNEIYIYIIVVAMHHIGCRKNNQYTISYRAIWVVTSILLIWKFITL